MRFSQHAERKDSWILRGPHTRHAFTSSSSTHPWSCRGDRSSWCADRAREHPTCGGYRGARYTHIPQSNEPPISAGSPVAVVPPTQESPSPIPTQTTPTHGNPYAHTRTHNQSQNVPSLRQAHQIVAELSLEVVGRDLEGLAGADVFLSVEEPVLSRRAAIHPPQPNPATEQTAQRASASLRLEHRIGTDTTTGTKKNPASRNPAAVPHFPPAPIPES